MATRRRPGVRVMTPIAGKLRSTTIKGQADQWQEEAYNVVDQVPMIGYLVNLKANTAGMGVLRAEEWQLDETSNTWDWRPSENEAVLEQLAELRCRIGGQPELMRRAVLHLEIAGRFYLCTTDEVDWQGEPTGARYWEPYSVLEVNVEPDRRQRPQDASSGAGTGKARRTATSRTTTVTPPLDPDTTIVLDCLRASPRRADEPDSPVKRLLPPARQLIWLNLAINAVARQRANGGAVFWPEELAAQDDADATMDMGDDGLAEDMDLADAASDAPTTDAIDAETRKLWEHFTRAIEDPESTAATAPMVVIGAAELGDKIKRLDLTGSFEHLASLRAEVREEIALGYDAPKEKATGMGGIAGWGAYSVDQDWNRRHVLPLASFVAEWLTADLLRPALVGEHGWDWEAAAKTRLVFDGSGIEARTDMAVNAKVAREVGAIGDSAFRSALGFTEADAPKPDERIRQLAEAMILRAPVATAPALAAFVGFPPEVADVFLSLAQAAAGAGQPPAMGADAGPDNGLPPAAEGEPPQPEGPDQGLTPGLPDAPQAGDSSAAIMAGIATFAGRRAAEVIGARARSRFDRAKGDSAAALRARLAGVPHERVYAELAPHERETLGMGGTLTELITGALSTLPEPDASAVALGVDPAPFRRMAEAVAAAWLAGVDLNPSRVLQAVAAQSGVRL